MVLKISAHGRSMLLHGRASTDPRNSNFYIWHRTNKITQINNVVCA